MLPLAGGWYVYSRRAFGDYAGFVVGCCDWMMQSVAIGYLAVAFGEFAAELQPALREHIRLLAVTCICLLMALNWMGLRTGSRTQELTSLTKAVALVGFVIACFVVAPSGTPVSASATAGLSLAPKGGLLLALVLSLQAVVVTYDGWYAAIYFAEEDEDPVRTLPRSSIGGVLACVAIFLLVNAALLHVLPMHTLATSQIPAANAAKAIIGSRGRDVVLMVSMLAAISTINASLLISPRILFAMARDGLMPRWMNSINHGGTPAAALLLCAGMALALVFSGSFETLIAVASFLYVAVYLSGFAALFALRAREPELTRPFRMWGYPWTNVGVFVASAAFLSSSVMVDPKDAFFTVMLIALSYPVYFFSVARRKTAPREAVVIDPTNPS